MAYAISYTPTELTNKEYIDLTSSKQTTHIYFSTHEAKKPLNYERKKTDIDMEKNTSRASAHRVKGDK